MIRGIGTMLLAFALCFSGDAFARSSHRNQSSPISQCYWAGTRYSLGGYCVGRGGVVQVCTSDGDWVSIGPCIAGECRLTCPG